MNIACSETQKFGHVTYFWNGNRSGKFDDKLETWRGDAPTSFPSSKAPWMKAVEITDHMIAAMVRPVQVQFLRCNFPTATWSAIRA
jgi:2,3-bisphosphoglycerate-independent phosphoglycerate mutase